MLPSNNILDQLLGGFDVGQPGEAGAIGSKALGADSIFADLLGEYGLPLKGPGFDQTLYKVADQVNLASVDADAVGEFDLQSNPVDLMVTEDITIQPDKTTIIPGQIAQPTLSTEEEEPNVPSLLSSGKTIRNALGETLANELAKLDNKPIPIELLIAPEKAPESKLLFRVLSSEVKDGNLNLELLSGRDTSSKPLQVSIPLESIGRDDSNELNRPVETLTQRPLPTVKENINQLVERLNVRSIEIDNHQLRARNELSTQPVTVKLVAEQAGLPMSLKGKLSIRDSRNLPTASQPTNHEAIDQPDKLKITSLPFEPAERGTLASPKPRLNQFESSAKLLFGKEPSGSIQEGAQTSDQLQPFSRAELETDQNSAPRQVTTKEAPDVVGNRIRLTIEDLSPDRLRVNSRSVMIRIEPENLGPARINLSLNHSQLTARITVESTTARLAVESSLDQLTEQLSRAGIEVDRMEVNVSSGDTRQNFFGRRPGWANNIQSSGKNELANEEDEGMKTQVLQPLAMSRPIASSIDLVA